MAFVVTVAFLNGALNIINKMVNVRAKQVLGMANGTLINYLEGTVLALALALLAGDRHLAQPGYLGSIPFLYYLGGVFGLVAMVLTIRGMEKVPVAVSAVVGYACIRLIRLVADKGKFGAFAYYCWAAGAVTIALSVVRTAAGGVVPWAA